MINPVKSFLTHGPLTMLKVSERLLVSSLVSRGKRTSASYQRCLGQAYF